MLYKCPAASQFPPGMRAPQNRRPYGEGSTTLDRRFVFGEYKQPLQFRLILMDGCASQRITGHPGRERRSCPSRLPESDSDPRCLSRDGAGARVIRGVAIPAGKQAKGRESEISAL